MCGLQEELLLRTWVSIAPGASCLPQQLFDLREALRNVLLGTCTHFISMWHTRSFLTLTQLSFLSLLLVAARCQEVGQLHTAELHCSMCPLDTCVCKYICECSLPLCSLPLLCSLISVIVSCVGAPAYGIEPYGGGCAALPHTSEG